MSAEPLHALERLLLPNVCVACERAVEPSRPDALFCRLCRSRLVAVTGGCRRCGQPDPPIGPCRFCRDWPNTLECASSAVWLSDEASEVIHHLKYGGYWALADEIAEVVVHHVRRPAQGVLMPVPLSRRRERERGYNQAAELARALSQRWQLTVVETALRRVRETRSQTTLSPSEREQNVRDAFLATPPPLAPTPPKHEDATCVSGAERPRPKVILVDDVLTTGATIVAAARALARGGWGAVSGVTFARAQPFAARAVWSRS
jgi:predicted amidophosphoribosyltransferase